MWDIIYIKKLYSILYFIPPPPLVCKVGSYTF